MKRFNVYEDSDAHESTSGGWVLYSEASERIASLEVLCRDLEVRLRDALEELGVRLTDRDASPGAPGSAPTEE